MRACSLALAIALTAAHVAAQGSIFITFPDRAAAATLGSLGINGNGFDPANSAISVVFTARGAVTATVPVYFSNATTIHVLVPPLVDAATGNLFDVPTSADLQVVQVSASSVITSNVIGGIPILSGTNAGVSLASDFEKAANAPNGPSTSVPAKGVIVAAAPQGTPSGTRPAMAFQGLGIDATAKWLAVSSTQQVTSLLNAVLPTPTAARFNGLYAGSARVSCTASAEGVTVTTGSQQALNFTVAGGTLTVTVGGSGTGTVSRSGQLGTVPVSAAGLTCQASGRFWEDGTGRAGASGSQTCAGPNVSCAGAWNVLRN